MTTFYNKQCAQIVDDYRASGGPWPFKRSELVEWALTRNLWKPSREDIRRMCGEALTEAMREVTVADESGRSVRVMLPARTTRDGEQGTFWDDLRTAPIAHVRTHVTQRRNAIAAECFHLHKVVRYSNEHRDATEQIELSLEFASDVRELDQPIAPKEIKRTRLTSTSSNAHPQRSAPLRRAPLASVSPNANRRPSSRPSAPV